MENNRIDLLTELRIFTVVVECRGFTAAAAKLGMNKPVITRAVQKLERELGVRLLNRTTRQIGTTDEGLSLYNRSRTGLEQVWRALADVKESRTEAKGLLRITCPITFGRRFVAPLIIAFKAQYPAIEFELSLQDTVLDLISSGVDMAIRGGPPDDNYLISKILAPMPLYVCASPAYLESHGYPRTPYQLSDYQCVRFRFRSTASEMAWEFLDGDKHVTLPVTGSLCVDDIEIACDAAVAGQGIAQLPGYVVVKHLRERRLVPLLGNFISDTRKFTLTYVNRREVQPLRNTLFAEFVATALSEIHLFALHPEEIRSLSPNGF